MQIQHLSVKVYAHQSEFDQEPLITVFHKWIREKRLGDELLIDVADYRHVPGGPGIMLIGDQGHYGLDTGGRLGLRYARKRDPIGPAAPALKQTFGRVLHACHAIEREPSLTGALTFDPGHVEVRIVSRLVAPANAATHEAFAPVLADFLAELYSGAEATIEPLDEPRAPYGVRVRITGEHDLAKLATRF